MEQGGYIITFDEAHPDGSDYIVTFGTVADPKIGPLTPSSQNGTMSATGFKVIVEYANQNPGDFSSQWDPIALNIMVLA